MGHPSGIIRPFIQRIRFELVFSTKNKQDALTFSNLALEISLSVCVVCNISDGVVIGVDSATTIGDPSNPVKVYEDVPKLFPIAELPIGLATFGLASLAGRTIASWAAELSSKVRADVGTDDYTMTQIAEIVRKFFWEAYSTHVLQVIADEQAIEPQDVAEDTLPVLGFVLGGFSSDSFYSEVWTISLPSNSAGHSSTQLMGPRHFASAWFAASGPIKRYMKGVEAETFFSLEDYIDTIREPLTPPERAQFREIAQAREYPIVFNGMPIAKGIKYVRFLVDLVIGHHMFAMGASIVGGRCKVGFVTYEKSGFQLIQEWRKQ